MTLSYIFILAVVISIRQRNVASSLRITIIQNAFSLIRRVTYLSLKTFMNINVSFIFVRETDFFNDQIEKI